MARKQRSKGPGTGGQQQPQQGSGSGSSSGGGWAPLRDSVRRDVEQAVSALAFAERLHQKMDTQRRAFLDFPRVMEQLRSGAMERLTASLSRLYEGGQGFDLQRFLRDLPLALAQLAVADKSKSQPPPETKSQPPELKAAEPTAKPDAEPSSEPAPSPAAADVAPAAVSPRLELRSKLLAAAPELARAAASYRRNVATIRRASLPRRSPGPWRADREVLEEAHRAVDFVQKLYDAYADAWADQPLPANLLEQTSAEVDRFLAWTQLDRYVELAVLAATHAPPPSRPGHQIVGAPKELPESAAVPAEPAAAAAATVESPKSEEPKVEEPKAEEPQSAEAKPDEPAAESQAEPSGA